MIVDDDSLLLEYVSQTLKDAGYRVTAIEDGEAALYMLPDLNLDLIILDLTMPRMGGLEVLEHIKANKSTASIPVMMLTGSTDADNVKAALKLGAKDYIAKPFDAERLLARIQKLFDRTKARGGQDGRMVWQDQAGGFDVPLQTTKTRIVLDPTDDKTNLK